MFRLPIALVLLALAAAVASSSTTTVGRDEGGAPAAQLRDSRLLERLSSEQVFELLKKALAADAGNEELRALVQARGVKLTRCTTDYQQWLIRQLVQNKRTPLATYLADVRAQYRKKCSETYKARLVLALVEVDEAEVRRMGALVGHLEEFKQMRASIYKLDEVPLSSLASALKLYLAAEVEAQMGASGGGAVDPATALREPRKTRALMERAIEELKETCAKLTATLGDFLWTLRILERPGTSGGGEPLGEALEQMLFATKVCKSLEPDSLEAQLEAQYGKIDAEQRQLVRKFVNLLHVPDQISLEGAYQVAPTSVRAALDRLTNDAHFLNTSGAAPFELKQKLLAALEEACAAHLSRFSDLLWLMDADILKPAQLESLGDAAVGQLKRVRVCALMPFSADLGE